MRSSWFLFALAAGLAFAATPARGARTKTISGRLSKVEGNRLTVRKPGLFSSSTVEIEMDKASKISGQLVPGVHVKIHYREESGHKIAVEVQAWPEYADKQARRAAGQLSH
jgi:hypothetical protein